MPTIRTMIIPAAGYGTRMQGLTGAGSKEIIDVCGRPALMYALIEADRAGITRVGIVIREGKKDIQEVVRDDPRLASIRSRIDIRFFNQVGRTGEAGAIETASDWIGDAPFAVHYPDNIIAEPAGTLAQLIARYDSVGTDLVLLSAALRHAQAPPCGLQAIAKGLFRLTPEVQPDAFPYGLRPTGVYIGTHHFLEACRCLLNTPRSGEVKDRDARNMLARRGHPTHGADLGARVLDIGNPDGYRMANATLNQRGPCE